MIGSCSFLLLSLSVTSGALWGKLTRGFGEYYGVTGLRYIGWMDGQGFWRIWEGKAGDLCDSGCICCKIWEAHLFDQAF